MPAPGYRKLSAHPSTPKDQRTQPACIFGAICPGRGQGRGHCHAPLHHRGHDGAPRRNPRHVAPDAHAVVLLDQDGWHQSRALVVPETITLVPLSACAPKINPVVKNIWPFMRDNWLSNRIFRSYGDSLDHGCAA